MSRYAWIMLMAVSLGVGAYIGSVRVAESAPDRPRLVTLQSRDIAVFGKVQCRANVEGGVKSLLCQRRPRSRARYETAIFPSSILVFRLGNPDPIFTAP